MESVGRHGAFTARSAEAPSQTWGGLTRAREDLGRGVDAPRSWSPWRRSSGRDAQPRTGAAIHPPALVEGTGAVRLALDSVRVRFGDVDALDNVSLDVADGDIVGLLGPSGSGKSTLLRVVAGIDRPTAGRIAIDGAEVAGPRQFVEPERRRVGMVFQDYALFPHLTVSANVGFGLHGLPRAEAADRIGALLDRLDLRRHADRYPHMLSGGERQRVALARALAPAPRLLLMDEPFSSLDERLRDRVRAETLALLRETRTTTIVVTHDPDEAMRIADRIALLHRGRLVQCGTPDDVYLRPATLFAARFFSDLNEVQGVSRNGCVHTPIGRFAAPHLGDRTPAAVCLRPQQVRLSAGPAGVPASVVGTAFLGEVEQILVAVDGLDAPVTVRSFGRTGLVPGDAVRLCVDPHEALVFARETE